MHLAGVHIERFRGLRHCSIQFMPTTVLIGENNCGKSSILDAIGMLLSDRWLTDDAVVGPLDFHSGSPQGNNQDAQPRPLRIDATFAERRQQEWSAELLERLGAAVLEDRAGLKQVRLRGEARPPQGSSSVHRTVSALDFGGKPIDLDAAALHRTLRTLKPVLRLRTDRTLMQGPLEAVINGGTGGNAGGVAQGGSQQTTIGERLGELHDALVDSAGGWPDLSSELRSLGELLALEPEEAAAVGGSSDRLVEILRDRSGRMALSGGAPLPLSRQGGGTQALVLMLLLGALLAGGARGLDPLADPLVILEDPEAHLHPRTLAYFARGVAALRAQKLMVTHSGDMLATVPMESIRRLHRRGDDVQVHQLHERTLTADESRKVNYHIRARRRTVLFARCWLLVEGETEFWLLPPLAQRMGYDLQLEGVACVEFAQCGLKPLIKAAKDFGIQWHLLADGDAAGSHYATAAADWIDDDPAARHVTKIGHPNIEACLWHHGYAQVYRDAAGLVGRRPRGGEDPVSIIAKAIRSTSKPSLAQRIIEAVLTEGSPPTPPSIAKAIEMAVELARSEGTGRRSRRGRG